MRKILVVVDMQNDFVDGSLGTKEAQAIIPNVCEKIRDYKLNRNKVIYTLDVHEENYLDTQEGSRLPVKHCIRDTYGVKLNSSIEEALIQNQFNKAEGYIKETFGSNIMALDLADKYESNQKEIEIELVGLCTDICVISNALMLKAFLPETRIVVDSSCCAGVTPESHENALAAMRLCQIDVI